MKAFVERSLVELALPIACAWVRAEERAILCHGDSLGEAQSADARRIGIAEPERIRICEVETIPPRLNPVLRFLGAKFGMTFAGTIGMALGHGIYLQREYAASRSLLLHELAHVAQYERLGMRRFLRQYLHECLTQGYPLGELEAEARDVTDRLAA
ncbi:MAG: DUF4157 domain-containing protein [Verrucomicrobiota bacterium]|nr:DUF4157 domain-containing protein [Verrucomicrobiota bacterium]